VPSQRILVVAEDPGLRESLAAAVQRGGGIPIRVANLAMLEGPQIPHRLVVFGWDGNRADLQALVSRLRDSAQLVAMIPPRPLADHVALLNDPHCSHVMTVDERGLWLLQVTIFKFVSGDLFGIEKYLPPAAPIQLTRMRDFEGRKKALDEVLAFASQNGVRGMVCNKIGSVCEELLMNALYDAPVDADGVSVFGNIDPADRVKMAAPKPVSIRYAVVNGLFAVSVRDRFGRLEKRHVLRYIEKCLRSGEQIDRKVYGAGLGIYLIANACTHYIINIAPGVATEVVCTFDCGTRTPLRALSVFLYPGAQPGQQPGAALTTTAAGGTGPKVGTG
jgi:hypothetical protein